MKKVPFPQANNLELIYNILLNFPQDGLVYSTVASENKITDRQGSYYLNALLFLDLVKKIKNRFFLSEKAILLKKTLTKHTFCSYLITTSGISELYNTYILINQKKEASQYLTSYIRNNYGLEEATALRRASTITNWFVWIEKNLHEDSKNA